MIETPQQAARRLADSWIAKGYKPEGLYHYLNAEGETLFYRFRLKNAETGQKVIRPFHWNGNGYVLGEPKLPGKRPLYGLTRVLQNPDADVWVVEGEAKVDTLNELGLVAVTSGSATSARGTEWSPLAGRKLRLWADNDDAGQAYAGDVAAIALDLGCTVTAVDVDKLELPGGGDVIDWLAGHPDAVRQDIEALPVITPSRDATAPGDDREVLLVRGDTIAPKPIEWLWEGWLAAGKFHVLAGRAGTGKTTVALAFVATVTNGGRWPDGTRAEPTNVLIWSGEDDPDDTLVPRLRAMGADMSRVYFVDDVRDGGEKRSFDPARDMTALVHKAVALGEFGLLVVDPVVSIVKGDSHKNAETRRDLQPLVDLASRLGCAVLGISHFTKGTAGLEPLERVTGSLAFGAVARVVLVAAKVQKSNNEPGPRRILARAKSTIGPDAGGYGYDVEQVELDGFPGVVASQIMWGPPIEGTACEILAQADGDSEDKAGSTKLDIAVEWLREFLSAGPQERETVENEAKAAGMSWATVKRAKEVLRIKPKKKGFGKDAPWWWSLEGAHTSQHPESDEHLSQNPHGDSLPAKVLNEHLRVNAFGERDAKVLIGEEAKVLNEHLRQNPHPDSGPAKVLNEPGESGNSEHLRSDDDARGYKMVRVPL